jgi:hypothetical protein
MFTSHEGSLEAPILALIQKEDNLSSFSIFIPIPLCNASYKVLTKIIANTLKKILPKILFKNQGGFMEKK